MNEFNCEVIGRYSSTGGYSNNSPTKVIDMESVRSGIILEMVKPNMSMMESSMSIASPNDSYRFSTTRRFLRRFIASCDKIQVFSARKIDGVVYVNAISSPTLIDNNAIGLRFENKICGKTEGYETRNHLVISSNIGKWKTIYTAEVDAVIPGRNGSSYVEVKTCKKGRWTGIKQSSSWLQCTLTSIDTIVLGEYVDKNGIYTFDRIRSFQISDQSMMGKKNISMYNTGYESLVELFNMLMAECEEGVPYMYHRSIIGGKVTYTRQLMRSPQTQGGYYGNSASPSPSIGNRSMVPPSPRDNRRSVSPLSQMVRKFPSHRDHREQSSRTPSPSFGSNRTINDSNYSTLTRTLKDLAIGEQT